MRVVISSRIKVIAGLVEHARRELEKAGMFDKDADYNGALAPMILELCACFAKQGHSGMSSEIALDIFERLAQFKNLAPISSDKDEWEDVSKYGPKEGPPMWQNKRNCEIFSNDGGNTWWSVGKNASSNLIVRKSVRVPKTVDICPHCAKEIGEKELFFDQEGKHYGTANQWYHRCCGKPVELPKDPEQEKWVQSFFGKTAAMLVSLDNIPEEKDVVSKVKISRKYEMADIYFESGKHVAVHLNLPGKGGEESEEESK